jgi:hypothetical protein
VKVSIGGTPEQHDRATVSRRGARIAMVDGPSCDREQDVNYFISRSRGSMSALKLASILAASGVIAGFAACNGKHDETVKGVDTMVTSTRVRDTTVVKSDTTIHTDTVKQTHHVPDAKKP